MRTRVCVLVRGCSYACEQDQSARQKKKKKGGGGRGRRGGDGWGGGKSGVKSIGGGCVCTRIVFSISQVF